MLTRKLYLVSTIGALSLASTSALAFGSMKAEDFVQKASVANEFEIESSQLALKKSQNPDVKAFAQHMVDDHSKTGDKLKDTLKSENSQIQPESTLDKKHQKLMDKLNGESGKSFDKKYISYQTDAHKDAVKLFTKYSDKGKDAGLKDFASQTLPTLQEHLKDVKDLKSKE